MSIYEPPGPPATLEGLIRSGETWTQKQVAESHRDDIKNQLKGLYIAGTVIWQAHRAQLLEEFEAGGGIKQVHDAGHFGDRGLSYVELENGRHIYASDLIQGKPVTLSQGRKWTEHFSTPYDQRSTVRLAFGGGKLGGSIERDRWSIDQYRLPGGFQALLEDDGYFPDIIGITESVEVTNPRSDEEEDDHVLPETFDAFSSISAQIWGSNLFGEAPMPDPYEQPEEYRRWALRGVPQLDIIFAAPVLGENGQYSRKAILGQHGSLNAPVGEVLGHIDRFRQLLTFCAFQNHPDLFKNTDPDTFSALPKIDAAIER